MLGTKDGFTFEIVVRALDADTIKRLILFLYTQDYDDSILEEVWGPRRRGSVVPSGSKVKEPLMHIRAYAAGEFYQLPDLKQLALVKFKSSDLASVPVVEVLENVSVATSRQTDPLRRYAMAVAATNSTMIIDDPKFKAFALHKPDVMAELFTYVVKSSAPNESPLVDKDNTLEATLAAERKLKEAAQGQVKELKRKLTEGQAGTFTREQREKALEDNYRSERRLREEVNKKLAHLQNVINSAKACGICLNVPGIRLKGSANGSAGMCKAYCSCGAEY